MFFAFSTLANSKPYFLLSELNVYIEYKRMIAEACTYSHIRQRRNANEKITEKIDFHTQHSVNGVAHSFGINEFIITKCEFGVRARLVGYMYLDLGVKNQPSAVAPSVRSFVRRTAEQHKITCHLLFVCLIFFFFSFFLLFDAAVALLFGTMVFFHSSTPRFFLRGPVPLCTLVMDLWVVTLSDLETNLYLCELRYGRQ